MTTKINGIRVSSFLTKGTPQGGVLSPVMWNIAFDGLLEIFSKGPVTCIGFADDAALVNTGSYANTLVAEAQSAVNKATDWGKENGLEFSPAKTAVILFARNKKPKKLAKLKVYDKEVEFVDSAKYLGLIIDSSLSWKPHIKLKLKKAKAHLQIVRAAGSKL